MKPSLSRRRFSVVMLAISALHSVKFVLGSVHLVFSVELILSADGGGNNLQILSLNARSLGYELALENSIDSNAFVVAESDWLGPGEALFEEDMLEVGRDKGVLDGIAVVVECLAHVFSPFLAQFLSSQIENLVVLNQALDHFRVHTLELDICRFEP